MKINVTEFIASLKEMTVLELNELVKAIEAEFGVTAAAPVAAAAAAAPEVEEGPAKYNVVLKEVGQAKINVIKELVDAAPKAIKEGVLEDEAKALKAKLEEAGATVELK
jgi:large subunit ribosomal protein L7/L12